MFCEKVSEKPKNDFINIAQHLFNNSVQNAEVKTEKPNVLFSFFISQIDSNDVLENCRNRTKKQPDNLFLVGRCKVGLDFDHHVEEAEKMFRKICPTEEFLPKPPDQEDIIFDDNTETSEPENGVLIDASTVIQTNQQDEEV